MSMEYTIKTAKNQLVCNTKIFTKNMIEKLYAKSIF